MNNEELPPPYDPNAPPSQNRPVKNAGKPNFWGMFGLGALLIIVSCLLCALVQNPFPLAVGFVAALISLFFEGRRGIFIGYLSTIGVCLLIAAITCGAMLTSHSP